MTYTRILLLALVLASIGFAPRLAATEPGPPPPMPMPPPPPAQPNYTNSYFTLTWTWNGSGFNIHGTAANPNGNSMSNATGVLSVIETWTLQGMQWVYKGDVGMYSKGEIRTAKSGYSSWQGTESTSYAVPSGDMIQSLMTQNSVSKPVDGSVTKVNATIATIYSDNQPSYITGSTQTVTTQTTPTAVSTNGVAITYNGPVGQQETVTTTGNQSWTDATHGLLASASSTYLDVDTTLNANGTTASSYFDSRGSWQTYAVAVSPQGVKSAQLLTDSTNATEQNTSYDANGKEVSWYRSRKSRSATNIAFTAGTVVTVWPQSVEVSASGDDHPQVGPAWSESLERTTTWFTPTQVGQRGYPDSFSGEVTTNDGEPSTLTLGWNAYGQLTQCSAATIAQAVQLYGYLYSQESSLMGMPPQAGDYPFFPDIAWTAPG
jgi:hypothetical protein